MYLITICVILSLWYLISYIKWWRNTYNYMKKLPGPMRLPLFGTKYRFLGVPREDFFKIGMENVNRYKPIFCTWSGSRAEVHVVKPEYLEIIMNNSIHIKKGIIYNFLKPWLGEGLLTSTGSKWHQHRKLITPTFHFKILENFMEIFVDKSQQLLEILDSKANGQYFNVYSDITHCALDIICETAMGVPVNAMSNKNNEYVKAIYEISKIIVWRFLRPFISDTIFKYMTQGRNFQNDLNVLHGFSKKVIAERKEMLKGKQKASKDELENAAIGKKKRLSFLDLLLEASEDGKVLSDKDIREEVDTFMFEGHDTTTAGMSWSLFLLGNHSEIQERVFEEVHGILQKKSTPTTLAELNEMKYLECVIKESLRLYPSVPFIVRDLQQEVTIGGYKIPAGVQASLHIYAVHRSPEYYPNPDKFDPDRFLPENTLDRHPYAYIPFSAGPRNCIGQKFALYEEKTILASLVNKYKITALDKQGDVKLVADLILRPLTGIRIKLEKRSG